jgi:predicted enzyme related to lactoylglutathione lyase/uncharacterized protein YndB with AHSA1/START domain
MTATAAFVYVTYIEATPEKIWGALTVDHEMTRQYFLHEHISDWKPGSRWEHRRADGSGVVDIVGKVVESVPPRRLVLTWVRPFEADNADKYSRVTFDIEPQGTVVCLTVTHENLEPGSEFHMGMVMGWPKVLSNLKTLLETGRTLNLDWQMEEFPGMDYTIIKVGEGTGGGMMKNPMPGDPDNWLPYILVDDVAASTEKAKSLGATVARDMTEVPNMGWFSVIVDPTGAAFGLWQPKMEK